MMPRFVAPTISAEMITTKELSPKAEYGYKKRFVRGDQAGLSPALRNIQYMYNITKHKNPRKFTRQ